MLLVLKGSPLKQVVEEAKEEPAEQVDWEISRYNDGSGLSTNLLAFDAHSFSVPAPKSLSPALQMFTSPHTFRHHLKTISSGLPIRLVPSFLRLRFGFCAHL